MLFAAWLPDRSRENRLVTAQVMVQSTSERLVESGRLFTASTGSCTKALRLPRAESTEANLAAQGVAPAQSGLESLQPPRFLENNKPTHGSGRRRVAESTNTNQALGRQRGAPSQPNDKQNDGGRPHIHANQLYNA